MLIVGELSPTRYTRTTIDNVRDRRMAKRKHLPARPHDKSWGRGKVPGIGLAGVPDPKRAGLAEKNVFTINALCQ